MIVALLTMLLAALVNPVEKVFQISRPEKTNTG
jgi:hypothetical protein